MPQNDGEVRVEITGDSSKIKLKMKWIKDITDDMMEEIHDAKHRIKRAMELKPLYPDIAQRESEIAAQELVHAEKDHKSAMELIEEYKKTRGEPPEYMMEYWKEKHEHFMEKYARAKCMIDLFNK